MSTMITIASFATTRSDGGHEVLHVSDCPRAATTATPAQWAEGLSRAEAAAAAGERDLWLCAACGPLSSKSWNDDGSAPLRHSLVNVRDLIARARQDIALNDEAGNYISLDTYTEALDALERLADWESAS